MTTAARRKRGTTQPKPKIQMIDVVLQSLGDAKAENTVAVDMRGRSPLADHMVVATGRSHRHVAAVAEQVMRALKEKGFGNARVEGLRQADWVLVDAGDVIVHVQRPEVRDFYNLEKIWAADIPSAESR
jgi:ribosome-associated protein